MKNSTNCRVPSGRSFVFLAIARAMSSDPSRETPSPGLNIATCRGLVIEHAVDVGIDRSDRRARYATHDAALTGIRSLTFGAANQFLSLWDQRRTVRIFEIAE